MNNNLKTGFFLFLNVFFSINIVLLNKWIYIHIGFPNITLSFIHFIVTFLGLIICEKLNVFRVKNVPIKEMFYIVITFCGFVILTNLSLAHNTVGTYQIAKMLTTPCVIIMQMLLFGKTFSTLVKLTLLPIIVGVVINFYYDIKFNILGTLFAGFGVLFTSFYQVLVHSKQKELQMDPMQLLYYQAPLSALMLVYMIPVVEPINFIITHNWSSLEVIIILLSSITAFFVNLTSYWIIGFTSPLTYNMVGHTKFCILLLGGSIFFHETLSMNQTIGITLTMIGVILYAHVKMKMSQSGTVPLYTVIKTTS